MSGYGRTPQVNSTDHASLSRLRDKRRPNPKKLIQQQLAERFGPAPGKSYPPPPSHDAGVEVIYPIYPGNLHRLGGTLGEKANCSMAKKITQSHPLSTVTHFIPSGYAGTEGVRTYDTPSRRQGHSLLRYSLRRQN